MLRKRQTQSMLNLLRTSARSAALCLALLLVNTASAQALYGVGDATSTTVTITSATALFAVSPTTGAANPICTLSGPSTANSVSSIDGQIYYITRTGVTPPNLYKINPLTCANTLVGAISGAAGPVLGNTTLRATHCPDGRFYVATNTAQFFEINANTGATLRTLNWSGLPTSGSGDFACTDNGNLYLVAPIAVNSTTYALFRADAATFATVPGGSSVPVTQIGASLGLAGTPNGIAEGPSGTGCAAGNPCLYVSNSANQTWRVNSVTGAATNAGTTGYGLTDLSRSFPVDISFSKTATPTTALQGQTVLYTLTASNPGPAVVNSIQILDNFPTGIASASWACTVQNPGSATLVATSCGATPTGTGNINATVSLSLGASLRYNVTATLSSSFTGTLTNAGSALINVPATDPNPSNNTSTVSTAVSPAANLSLTKDNGSGTLNAGQTTTYILTVTNSGPGSANNAVVSDPVAAGLSCSTVTCSIASGAAACPAPASLTISNLQNTGIVIPAFPANSSVNLNVTCQVTASGA